MSCHSSLCEYLVATQQQGKNLPLASMYNPNPVPLLHDGATLFFTLILVLRINFSNAGLAMVGVNLIVFVP
jgi:hypothetical protein